MPKPQTPAIARVNIPQADPQPSREMKAPSVNIDDLLKSVNAGVETKKVSMPQSAMKKGGSTGKNSVSIKL
jgi:hypothetical protein